MYFMDDDPFLIFILFLQGPNYCVSADGHDKLCGYQKSTFPLHIYGAQDTFSGKILFLKVWTSNNNPSVIAYHYFEYLSESKGIPIFIIANKI